MRAFVSFTSVLAVLFSLSLSAVANETPKAAVDGSFDAIRKAVEDAALTEVVEIDHARLAAAEGVEMPPSRVQIFSDPGVEVDLLRQNARVGLDLPFRVLSYAEKGQSAVTYTDASFLAHRHSLEPGPAAEAFDATLESVLSNTPVPAMPAPTEGLTPDFGIIELTSVHDFKTTIARLKDSVTAQGDTVWFGEVDFQAQAKSIGTDLRQTTLLLFGGPAPGGVAMAQFPAIGLDAFCQKLLVYVDEGASVKVIFNDIAALAELHYGTSAKPHHGLNKRLTETFKGAVN